MAHFNNEAEFAGVLGHEIGHVTARHSAKQQSTQTLAQLGLIVGYNRVQRYCSLCWCSTGSFGGMYF